jgi:hypothetical protein
MSDQLKYETVTGPQGTWNISTIRTLSGGGSDYQPLGSLIKDSDFADTSPWPYEVMVFREIGTEGRYHAPHTSEADAMTDHARIARLIRDGKFVEGIGVKGFLGLPSMTSEDWNHRVL